MTTYKRQELPALLQSIAKGETTQVYLIFGERYLCQQAADQILAKLLPDEKQRTSSLVLVDGDQEEKRKTLNELRTYSLFGGRRVIRVADSRLLHSTVIAKTLWEKGAKKYQDNDLAGAGRYLRQVLEIGGMTPADLEEVTPEIWKAKLGFARPQESLAWVGEVFEKTGLGGEAPETEGGQDVADLYTKAFEEGLPSSNILVLVADAADKRKKLFKYIAKHGSVIDLAVDQGSNKAATDVQKEVLLEVVRQTLARLHKKMESKTLEIFLERVGFHPVAAAMESEKLALYTEEREMITVADLNEVIGRTREEAVFELSEAFSDRDLTATLIINSRLLENGLHPLVIIGALRKHLRKMLLICSLRDLASPSYSPGLSFAAFKGGYLERLKGTRDLPKELPGHPYALYMMFRKTDNFQTATLTRALTELLAAEYRLKSSALPEKIVLEKMFLDLLRQPAASAGKVGAPLR